MNKVYEYGNNSGSTGKCTSKHHGIFFISDFIIALRYHHSTFCRVPASIKNTINNNIKKKFWRREFIYALQHSISHLLTI